MSDSATSSSKTSLTAEDEFSSQEVVIVDGDAKFRDGKKWKQRFCVLTKLSPAADCLQLQVYRDEKDRAKNAHTKASLSLQDFLAVESGFTLDKESHTLAIICQELCVVLAFDNRERLIQWSVRISNNLGQGQHFLLQLASAPPKSKITPGPVKLHVTDKRFCLTSGIPPKLLGQWEVSHLRRYGAVEGKMVFEGGSRCGKGEGIHVLIPDPPQLQQIIDALDMAAKGQLSRTTAGTGVGSALRESRRFGNVTDSPRKHLGSSRLSELRIAVIAADSPVAVVSPVPIPASISVPRESWSAEALCSACGEGGTQQNGMWMEMDNCDSLSIICPSDEIPLNTSMVSSSSPAKKPLPSAMERCMSCMSKLGQQGGNENILSPSWTMDLPVTNITMHAHAASSQNQNLMNQSMTIHHQGSMSIGSGNSDRLSISSHGSGGGGMGTEFYNYDTPRNLAATVTKMRTNTPPGINIGCPSPSPQCRGPGSGSGSGHRSHISMSIAPTTSTQCQCQGINRVVGSSSGLVYCGDHKSHKTPLPQAINFVSGSNSNGGGSHVGPYENYDFPRSVPTQCHTGQGQGQGCIDWSKKLPMDRSSIATTHTTLSSLDEYYDTPKQSCVCCNPNQTVSNCHCCVQKPHLSNPSENYDVPPPHSSIPPSTISINGEGKMPLVAGAIRNPDAIYAQVDKSKKTPRLPPQSHHLCDIPIYENRTMTHPQPNYMNFGEGLLPQSNRTGKPPAPAPAPQPQPDPTICDSNPHANYVNLQFTESLQLYENAKEIIESSNIVITKEQHLVQVHPQPEEKKLQPQEGIYENDKPYENEKTYENCLPPPAPAPIITAKEIIPPVSAAVTKSAGSSSATPTTSSAEESRRGSQDSSSGGGGDGTSQSQPLRRSSSVPCKTGHANRGSASSSDSGVSGDGALFFEDSSNSPSNDIGSLCLHESLPRKGQRVSPGKTIVKDENREEEEKEDKITPTSSSPPVDLANRHYETIEEVEAKNPENVGSTLPPKTQNLMPNRAANPVLVAVKADQHFPRKGGDCANSCSSNSDMSDDYIETLSSCSTRSVSNNGDVGGVVNSPPVVSTNLQITSSPKKSTAMKPRSGKEYFKINRNMFKKD